MVVCTFTAPGLLPCVREFLQSYNMMNMMDMMSMMMNMTFKFAPMRNREVFSDFGGQTLSKKPKFRQVNALSAHERCRVPCQSVRGRMEMFGNGRVSLMHHPQPLWIARDAVDFQAMTRCKGVYSFDKTGVHRIGQTRCPNRRSRFTLAFRASTSVKLRSSQGSFCRC